MTRLVRPLRAFFTLQLLVILRCLRRPRTHMLPPRRQDGPDVQGAALGALSTLYFYHPHNASSGSVRVAGRPLGHGRGVYAWSHLCHTWTWCRQPGPAPRTASNYSSAHAVVPCLWAMHRCERLRCVDTPRKICGVQMMLMYDDKAIPHMSALYLIIYNLSALGPGCPH